MKQLELSKEALAVLTELSVKCTANPSSARAPRPGGPEPRHGRSQCTCAGSCKGSCKTSCKGFIMY